MRQVRGTAEPTRHALQDAREESVPDRVRSIRVRIRIRVRSIRVRTIRVVLPVLVVETRDASKLLGGGDDVRERDVATRRLPRDIFHVVRLVENHQGALHVHVHGGADGRIEEVVARAEDELRRLAHVFRREIRTPARLPAERDEILDVHGVRSGSPRRAGELHRAVAVSAPAAAASSALVRVFSRLGSSRAPLEERLALLSEISASSRANRFVDAVMLARAEDHHRGSIRRAFELLHHLRDLTVRARGVVYARDLRGCARRRRGGGVGRDDVFLLAGGGGSGGGVRVLDPSFGVHLHARAADAVGRLPPLLPRES